MLRALAIAALALPVSAAAQEAAEEARGQAPAQAPAGAGYEIVPASSQVWALPADSLTPRPAPRPAAGAAGETRCTPDGAHCIARASQAADTCTVIGTAAKRAGIDPHFFARLLWRESLFDPSAVSPAGARGIAQFMPATAQRRGLVDPFNPAAAIFASADYLAELTERFGNPGLAAAAYNAGEARVTAFVSRDRRLPAETRAYVPAITGHSGVEWRDEPPGDPDYALQPGQSFSEACLKLATSRRLKGFATPAAIAATAPPRWKVVIATGRTEGYVRKIAREQRRAFRSILLSEEVDIVSLKLPGQGRRARPAAVIQHDNARDAQRLCGELQAAGTFCLVIAP